MLTLKKVIAELKPSVFFVEETKFKDEGKIKLEKYIIFEFVRKSRDGGGGLALGCVKQLKPSWVREGDENVEALSVEIFVQSMKVRCCAAYGCQESELLEKKLAFWNYLDEEVAQASASGAGLVIHFDGNLWAGKNIKPDDPRPQNKNGKLFEGFLSRNHHLTVVNSLSLCEGLITRSRLKDGKLEKSVLDFFVVCSRVLPFVKRMVIDEGKKYILTNYEQVKKGGKASDTDHATEILDVDLNIIKEKPERRELFNFKNIDAQKLFQISTSETDEFSKCFTNMLPVHKQVERWRNVLQSHFKKSFTKIRITNKNFVKPINQSISKLIDQRNSLIQKNENICQVQVFDRRISEMEAEEKRNLIIKHFKSFSEDSENINLHQVWKTLKNLWPKCGQNLPSAKRNFRGKIVSGPTELKKLLAQEYKERLRCRPRRPDFLEILAKRKSIFKMKLKLAENNKSSPWLMSHLERALKDLKKDKSRDHEGLINEIFQIGVIGHDLKESMLMMFNKLKREKKIVSFMTYSNITTVPKKGSKLELKNERGIFRVSVPRSILMRMIYNDEYPVIDDNMSDCQMGARKNKGCKNNIFIVNGIIHDVLRSKRKNPVLLQIYDYAQMFDSIDLEEAISDIYDAGFKDDKLALVYEANKEIEMAVNTPSGLSERQIIKNSVLQGDTWGSILASVQVDSIGKDCKEAGYGYLYKDALEVNVLGLVDDMIGVTEAGYQAQQMNVFLNVKSAEKGLQFGKKKCKAMLIGKHKEKIINNELKVDTWKVVHEENLETGVDVLVETYEGEVAIEMTEEQKYLGFLVSSSGNNMVNINQIKKKSKGIIRRIFSKLESLNLQNYYFECGLIFLKVMLRSSILYTSETYYDIKEN